MRSKEEISEYNKNYYKNLSDEKKAEYNKNWRDKRHDLGISKRYIVKYGGSKKPASIYKKRYKALRTNAGELSIKTIQLVYEDNIKKHGTLTCIYCEKPIQFGKDTLEHKIPLSRGGTNLYENLAVACFRCNAQKKSKTPEEYFIWLKGKGISNEQIER